MRLWRPQTLRVRLVLAAAGATLAALALFGVATVVVVRHELRSSLDTALRQRASQVAQLAVSAPAVLDTPGALESPVSGRQIVVEVLDAHGRILARSLTLGAQLLPQDRLARAAIASGTTGFENVELDNRLFRLYAAPIALSGPAGGGAVLVASDTTDIARTTDHLGFVVVLIGAGVALLAGLLAAVLTRRGLLPLRRLADASHELRTPVTALLGNVEFAARHGADAEVLEELQRDARRLARLVDDLLALERAGGSADSRGPVDLGAVVAEIVRAHTAENGRLVTVGVEAPVTIRGDASELTRAVENLVENALVHGPPGGQVTVSVAYSEDRRHVLLTVSDEGSGPDPGDHDRLFERFWRGPGASARPGSGLGLSIVAAIAARHDGTVRVHGSAFTLDLPALERQDSHTALTAR